MSFPLANVLEVPELSAQEFYEACLEQGSGLTVYACIFLVRPVSPHPDPQAWLTSSETIRQDVRKLKVNPSTAVSKLTSSLEGLRITKGNEHKLLFLALEAVSICVRNPPIVPGAVVKSTLQEVRVSRRLPGEERIMTNPRWPPYSHRSQVIKILTRYGENRVSSSLMGALGLAIRWCTLSKSLIDGTVSFFLTDLHSLTSVQLNVFGGVPDRRAGCELLPLPSGP